MSKRKVSNKSLCIGKIFPQNMFNPCYRDWRVVPGDGCELVRQAGEHVDHPTSHHRNKFHSL